MTQAKSFRKYNTTLTATINRKGVLDIDTVKGCHTGMQKYPIGGCYGLCYAAKVASYYGMDFKNSVIRNKVDKIKIEKQIKKHLLPWFRIGTMGEPSDNWDWTVEVVDWLSKFKTPVIITKHWHALSDEHLKVLKKCKAVINTSTSPLDSESEIKYRLDTYKKIRDFGLRSILRIVSAKFGKTYNGQKLDDIQRQLFNNIDIIDNPLRIPMNDKRVICGDIIADKHKDLGGGSSVSIAYSNAYLGKCNTCPDQCGIKYKTIFLGGLKMAKNQEKLFESDYIDIKNPQLEMFVDKIEFEYVKSVIGSGYEKDVAKLAIEDKVAYRAARKNMQVYSAIILKINDEFSGFFTFQVNHDAKEFCLLQSAMRLDRKDKKIYQTMVSKIIEQNTYGYPMIMTVSTKHDLERPQVFEEIGFKSYLNLSGFEYMVYGALEQVRMKRLAHATMTNTWNSTKGDWLKMKREWNEKLENAGEKYNIKNPKLATREGCWQGESGFSNVVLSTRTIENDEIVHNNNKSLNLNASVLDPVACECILRFFMPRYSEGNRVYNPFGGGVQMGFVAGNYGFEYVASEIRQNQCDANNKLCSDYKNITWIKADSSTYLPVGDFDLIFSCPPYYRVEKYIDYDNIIPDGEINSMKTYEDFRSTLFSGYKIAIRHLKEDRFFVIMVGDSRDNKGVYYGIESEMELFLKEQGLHLYNKIIYLEAEFTRLAQAKKTLDYRKFPKREQKIIVGYKGNIKKIKELFPPIGRL